MKYRTVGGFLQQKSINDQYAYDITYSGEVREINKITRQDYRGWRAVRVEE